MKHLLDTVNEPGLVRMWWQGLGQIQLKTQLIRPQMLPKKQLVPRWMRRATRWTRLPSAVDDAG